MLRGPKDSRLCPSSKKKALFSQQTAKRWSTPPLKVLLGGIQKKCHACRPRPACRKMERSHMSHNPRCRLILRTQKGTMILTTTHVLTFAGTVGRPKGTEAPRSRRCPEGCRPVHLRRGPGIVHICRYICMYKCISNWGFYNGTCDCI